MFSQGGPCSSSNKLQLFQIHEPILSNTVHLGQLPLLQGFEFGRLPIPVHWPPPYPPNRGLYGLGWTCGDALQEAANGRSRFAQSPRASTWLDGRQHSDSSYSICHCQGAALVPTARTKPRRIQYKEFRQYGTVLGFMFWIYILRSYSERRTSF